MKDTSTEPKKINRTLLAYHEAGHAVTAVALGIALEGVSIISDEESEGRASSSAAYADWLANLEFDDSLEPEERTATYRAAAVSIYAGALSEELLTGKSVAFGDAKYEGDTNSLSDILLRLCDDPTCLERLDSELMTETRALLTRHWSAVEGVAAALLEREELTGEEVKRIVESAS